MRLNLINAIKKAHQLKDQALKVEDHGSHGSFYSYCPFEDKGFIEYAEAKAIVEKYKIINKMLSWINYI